MIKLIPIALLAVSLGACASVTRGTDEQMSFISEPGGAAMTTSYGFSCTTPCTVDVARNQGFSATFTLAGYQQATIPVSTRLSGNGTAGFAGNILLGGLVGMAVDAGTGAALDHTPNPVIARLVPLGRPPAARSARRRKPVG